MKKKISLIKMVIGFVVGYALLTISAFVPQLYNTGLASPSIYGSVGQVGASLIGAVIGAGWDYRKDVFK